MRDPYSAWLLKNVRTRPDLMDVNRCVFGQKLENTKLCTDVMSV